MYQITVYGKRVGGPLTWDEARGTVERLKWSCNGLEIKPYRAGK
ncbi:hypothetical protein J2TS6_43700 [Paenibacillus albilobatus]|uniref:Uncharacterized protein n=1 Tax=Paenibacillus albilobatus TaxID=2716884 RepID=A0A919XID2_9BACL|nr:hypothetical protein [Paenibacillus albilobatus]GIO33229.1 hypothetical protein J2TS6_43700 [Paenibacillus albilobatus]